jgi:hypothetical protein
MGSAEDVLLELLLDLLERLIGEMTSVRSECDLF